jgi:hypothetical protein
MPQKRALKLRELLKRLELHGIVALPSHGQSKRGMGTEISKPVVSAALRRFGINEDEFWK